jgi:hypothetical protein
MNAIQTVYLAASILAGVMLAGLRRRTAGSPPRFVALSLAILILSLLCVGVVSHTFIRHVVQVIPPVVALLLVARGSAVGTSAAAPILTFWFGVMVNIWMFLLGIARIFTGTFTPIEIALTITIAFACGLALAGIVQSRDGLSGVERIVTAFAFGIGQLVAMIASFQPVFR